MNETRNETGRGQPGEVGRQRWQVVDRCVGPRASMRARSYQASPGPAKASALCISLWMVQVNLLVNQGVAVEKRGCGKVDNRWDADLMQVVGRSRCPQAA